MHFVTLFTPEMSSTALRGRLCHSERGASTMEFLLVFPFLLMLLLVILQVALLVQAKLVVKHAANVAARSAATTIAARASSSGGQFEDRNQINQDDPYSPKKAMIRWAAAFACLSISPVLNAEVLRTTGTIPDPNLIVPMQQVAMLFPASINGENISQQLLSRAHYAYDRENTQVEILGENGEYKEAFRDHEKITVRVTYRYYLAVPFANRLFGRSYDGAGMLSRSGWYLPITEQSSVINEGEPTFPAEQMPKGSDLHVENR
jgi:hypothetical protein